MKLKIEACYDAEEAAKFKGSSNWFQRFKKKNTKWYQEGPTRRNKSPPVDTKYRRWLPKYRYKINIDQVPLPFVNEHYKMIQIVRAL